MIRHSFALLNHIDGELYEMEYYLYSPLIKNIEVLKLEKSVDEDLNYLRDCDAKYSTFPFDMPKILLPPGEPVPINDKKVLLEFTPSKWFSA